MKHRETYLEESVFKWARNEMQKETLMARSSYARIAGLQSEISRVTVTRVAGSELEYKRVINMHRKDMIVNVNNIRREQAQMKKCLARYSKKLRQSKKEREKRERDQMRRDNVRKHLEDLTMSIQFDGPIPSKLLSESAEQNDHEDSPTDESCPLLGEKPVYLQTGYIDSHDIKEENGVNTCTQESETDDKQLDREKQERKRSVYSPVLPMISEDEKEREGEEPEQDEERDAPITVDSSAPDSSKSFGNFPNPDLALSTTPSKPGRTKKQAVSFSDLIKLRYTSNTKKLFDLVHILARKHGIEEPKTHIPDPRDSVVLRGSTNQALSDSVRRTASVLYAMKYGYAVDQAKEFSPSSSPIKQGEVDNDSDKEIEEDAQQLHQISIQNGQSRYSRSPRNIELPVLVEPASSAVSPRPPRRDSSLPLLAEKYTRIRQTQQNQQDQTTDSDSSTRYLSVPKPSSSRSTKSLPPILRHENEKGKNTVSWTHAFGLLKAIHSLDGLT
ncbi:hypothetical protein CHS0354_001182 [Potamilus streckersoni]|uniref:Uncharacterized protein n=1 Tax=Potamilus streckersoni TaxID=2493646 RepID=A0AAE0W7N5_9BIVA|nr:hypothetical protein CHS0354_001182 [Potamilus streckersoni]